MTFKLKQQVNHTSMKMENSTCFCMAATVVFILTLVWKLKRGHGSGFFTAVFVASLCFILPPAVHGVLLLVYSSILAWFTKTRSELLPVKNRAVLITGNTHPRPGMHPSVCLKMQSRRYWSSWRSFLRYQSTVPQCLKYHSGAAGLFCSMYHELYGCTGVLWQVLVLVLLKPPFLCIEDVILGSDMTWRGGSAGWECWCLLACWMRTELELRSWGKEHLRSCRFCSSMWLTTSRSRPPTATSELRWPTQVRSPSGGDRGWIPALIELCCCRSLGLGQQCRNLSVSLGRRAPANQNIETLHGCELPGYCEDVSGVPPAVEEVQRTHHQHVQPGRSMDPQHSYCGLMMVRRGWSVLSHAGEVPLPQFSAYGASKAALSIYSKAMRLELSAWGVRVSLIQPSGFRTSTFNSS